MRRLLCLLPLVLLSPAAADEPKKPKLTALISTSIAKEDFHRTQGPQPKKRHTLERKSHISMEYPTRSSFYWVRRVNIAC